MSKLSVVILVVMLVSTCSKPLESTDDQLSEMEKDLASLSNTSEDTKQDTDDDEIPESLLKDLQEQEDDKQEDDKHESTSSNSDEDEDKIRQSLLDDLLTQSDKSGHGSKPLDIAALQGFTPGTLSGDDSKRSMETKGDLLSNDDINDTQKRLFEILAREESEEKPKNAESNSPDEEENKDKIPEDLLKDLEAGNREDEPRKPESTWLEPADENAPSKKEILTHILMDEIVKEIKEKNKRGEKIPDQVLDLLRKYNAKRSIP